jgi:hypothetical protein
MGGTLEHTAIHNPKKSNSPCPTFLRKQMAYQESVKQAVGKAPKTLGNQLGRWATHLDFSVVRISKSTGATRQTIYSWLNGGNVTPSYRERVILRTSPTAEQAWRKACQRFNIKA